MDPIKPDNNTPNPSSEQNYSIHPDQNSKPEDASMDMIHEPSMDQADTDHELELISSGDDNISPDNQSPEAKNIVDGQESINPDDQDYETLTIQDDSPVYSDESESQSEMLGMNTDENKDNDLSHELEKIKEDQHELSNEKPLDIIYAENNKVGNVDPGKTQISENQGTGEVKYSVPPGKVSTVAEWGQVPFVGDVIGLATSAYNNIKDELGAILNDKRYQVYLACQALDKLMTDRVYGSGSMSAIQALQWMNMIKNQWTSQLGSKAINLIKDFLLGGGGVDKSIGKFNIDNEVTGSPKRGTVADALDGAAGRYTTFRLPNPYKDAITINPEVHDPSAKFLNNGISDQEDVDKINPDKSSTENTREVKSTSNDQKLDAFLAEYQKVVNDNQDKELKYWDDDGNTYNAPLNGYKTIAGFSLDSTHLWDISFKRFTEEGPCYVPPPPSATDKDSEGWVPALSYQFEDYRADSKDLDAPLGYQELKFNPMRKKGTSVEMNILDNQFGHWGEWLRQIAVLGSSDDESFVAPYKCLCYEMDIYILDISAHIRYLRKLIVTLDDPDKQYTGEEDPSVVTHSVYWRIVGELSSSKDAQTKKW